MSLIILTLSYYLFSCHYLMYMFSLSYVQHFSINNSMCDYLIGIILCTFAYYSLVYGNYIILCTFSYIFYLMYIFLYNILWSFMSDYLMYIFLLTSSYWPHLMNIFLLREIILCTFSYPPHLINRILLTFSYYFRACLRFITVT